MNLSILEKLETVLKYSFSSFLQIELFIISLLFFLLLYFNLKQKKDFVKYAFLGVIAWGVLSIILSNRKYALYCFDKVIKLIMNYLYFPSPVVFFFIFLSVNAFLIFMVFNDDMKKLYRIYSMVTFIIIDFLFLTYYSIIIMLKIDLTVVVDLYKNNNILSIVQVSNFLFFIWILISLFYGLYLYFKHKYDEKIEI